MYGIDLEIKDGVQTADMCFSKTLNLCLFAKLSCVHMSRNIFLKFIKIAWHCLGIKQKSLQGHSRGHYAVKGE